MNPTELLTLGLLIFAGIQVWLQWRTERMRRADRTADRNEAVDRAFDYAWAEHFRLESLADVLDRSNLIELAALGLISPADVRPTDTARFLEALGTLGREAGVLGGVILGASVDVQRNVGILVESAKAFYRDAPGDLSAPEKIAWIKKTHGDSLAPWESSTKELVEELSLLTWDAIKHNPRASVERTLNFSDDLDSRMAQAAIKGLLKRSQTREPKQELNDQ